jgi:hypothetical protein
MSAEPPQRKCPSCHGTNLVDGRLGMTTHTFIPEGRWMWVGYAVKAFVCLDCGLIGQYLDKADILDLQRRQG